MAAAFMAETVYRESRRSSLRIARSRRSLGRHAVIDTPLMTTAGANGTDRRRQECPDLCCVGKVIVAVDSALRPATSHNYGRNITRGGHDRSELGLHRGCNAPKLPGRTCSTLKQTRRQLDR